MIVTLNEHEEEPHEFVAVHVTVDVPVGNDDPEIGKHCTGAEGVPVAVGSIHDTLWLSHCVTFGGHALITGLSLIVTVNVQLELPHELTAEHVTTVCPAGNVEPDAGEHVTVAAGVPVAVGSVQVAIWLSH